MGLTEAHSLVSLLITPSETPPSANKDWFTSILETKVKEYSSKCGIVLNPSPDTHFDYVRCCVNALINLRFELGNVANSSSSNEESNEKPKIDPDVLSIAQQKNVQGLVQMILALGVLPNLLPGVGTPVSKRSAFLQSIIETVPDRSILERYKQLIFSTDSLLELAKYKQFHAIIITNQLGDILACLLQIAHAPLAKPKEETEEKEITVEEDVPPPRGFQLVQRLGDS